MMLTEALGKRILRESEIAIPNGVEIPAGGNVDPAAMDFPVAVKAQVPVGGRGNSGGVLRCGDAKELALGVPRVLAKDYQGEKAHSVLVEPWIDAHRELYLSITIDVEAGGFTALYSPLGGVGVEASSKKVVQYAFGRTGDFRGHRLRQILQTVESDDALCQQLVVLARRLLQAVNAHECTTVEINPLLLTRERTLVAADAKVVLDPTAAHRRRFTADMRAASFASETAAAASCRQAGLAFVELDGEVGLISGGAGMTMAAMDTIQDMGARAACFLDISGNPTPTGISVALEVLTARMSVDSILVSIFGGGLHVDRIARSIVSEISQNGLSIPVHFRLAGVGEQEATELLRENSFVNHPTLESAVSAATSVQGRTQ